MTRDRFEALAAAWGADPGRWPIGERDAARAFERDHPDDAATVLRAERALDALLDAWTVPPPAPFLDGAIAARAVARIPPLHRFRVWLAGGAAAAALAGGITAGIAVATLVSAPPPTPSPLYGVWVLGTPFDPGPEPGPEAAPGAPAGPAAGAAAPDAS